MMQNKRIIGITGGSGSGKSYISGLLREYGIPVIDADRVAHEVMNESEPCKAELMAEFGKEIYENGVLNRQKLAKIVFSSEDALLKLNEISHKYILESIDSKIEGESANVVGIDGAVLLESGIKCDVMIGVLAPFEMRKKRIMERDKLSEEAAMARLLAQKPDFFYVENCDFVVENDGSVPDIKNILKRVCDE